MPTNSPDGTAPKALTFDQKVMIVENVIANERHGHDMLDARMTDAQATAIGREAWAIVRALYDAESPMSGRATGTRPTADAIERGAEALANMESFSRAPGVPSRWQDLLAVPEHRATADAYRVKAHAVLLAASLTASGTETPKTEPRTPYAWVFLYPGGGRSVLWESQYAAETREKFPEAQEIPLYTEA